MRIPKSNFFIKNCPCGNKIKVWNHLIDRKKYCSQKCKYKFRIRPKGLNYNLKVKNKGWFNKGDNVASCHYKWTGDRVTYGSLHDWIFYHRGKAKICEFCGSKNNVEWANKSHEYKRDLNDWLSLCKKCHRNYDKPFWGIAKKLFLENRRNYNVA